MNQIQQIEPSQATGKNKELFSAVQGKLGIVPNLMRVLGNSPAALEGYLALSGALATGLLSGKLREQIALAVAEINACGYCLSAHTLLGGKAGLSRDEIFAARRSSAADAKADAAIKLARTITVQHGQISDGDLQSARDAGLSDAEVIEVVEHVALNILTNYTNNVARTVIDFPEVKPGDIESETPAACTAPGCSH